MDTDFLGLAVYRPTSRHLQEHARGLLLKHLQNSALHRKEGRGDDFFAGVVAATEISQEFQD